MSRTTLALVCWLGCIGSIFSEDDLLGMPKPRDPQKPGAVMLHGGGVIGEAEFRRFVELAGGKDARLVLVPSAGYREADYSNNRIFVETISRRYASWLRLKRDGDIRSFQFLYTDNTTDADDRSFVRALESATGVWFSGGSQSRLNYRYVGKFPEQTRFQIALRGVVERGGVVGGTSAGMAIMPEIITLYEERESMTAPATAVTAHGFGLLKNAIVEQHFDGRGGRLERFTGLLRDNAQLDELAGRAKAGERMVGLAVEERTALIAQGERLEVVGSGSAHVFLKSRSGRSFAWHELLPGEIASLKSDKPGLEMVGREELRLRVLER